MITITGDMFTTNYTDWSDIGHSEFETIAQKLKLNKTSKRIGDTIFGYIDYAGLKPFTDSLDLKRKIDFSIPFHCIIRGLPAKSLIWLSESIF